MPKVTDTQIKQALAETGGVVATAARRLGVNRLTLHRRLSARPELAEARNAARDLFLDEAEASLLELVRAGNVSAVIFTLKTLGKSRGWAEQDTTTGGGPVVIKIIEAEAQEL